MAVKWYSIVVLIYNFRVTNELTNFSYFYEPFLFPLLWHFSLAFLFSFIPVCPILTDFVPTLGTNSLLATCEVKSSKLYLLLWLFMVSFNDMKFLHFNVVNLIIFYDRCFCVFKHPPLGWRLKKKSMTFTYIYPKIFQVSPFTSNP